MFDSSHTQPVSPVYQRRSSLEFLDKVAQEAVIIFVVDLLDASLGDYTAIVGLQRLSRGIRIESFTLG